MVKKSSVGVSRKRERALALFKMAITPKNSEEAERFRLRYSRILHEEWNRILTGGEKRGMKRPSYEKRTKLILKSLRIRPLSRGGRIRKQLLVKFIAENPKKFAFQLTEEQAKMIAVGFGKDIYIFSASLGEKTALFVEGLGEKVYNFALGMGKNSYKFAIGLKYSEYWRGSSSATYKFASGLGNNAGSFATGLGKNVFYFAESANLLGFMNGLHSNTEKFASGLNQVPEGQGIKNFAAGLCHSTVYGRDCSLDEFARCFSTPLEFFVKGLGPEGVNIFAETVKDRDRDGSLALMLKLNKQDPEIIKKLTQPQPKNPIRKKKFRWW